MKEAGRKAIAPMFPELLLSILTFSNFQSSFDQNKTIKINARVQLCSYLGAAPEGGQEAGGKGKMGT